jgi:rSAM/selenodomain-associated transferase 1
MTPTAKNLGPVTGKLLVFARFPEPGAVKTRLIPALGAEGAARLHGWLLARTLVVAGAFAVENPEALELWYTGADEAAMRRWLDGALAADATGLAGVSLRPQTEGDLGERLNTAFARVFAEGARAAVTIGTDCPALATETLAAAFAKLAEREVVLGPAADGGYYLIGLRRPEPELFRGISWGGPEVLAETLARAREATLEVGTLDTLADVDRPEDLEFVPELVRRLRAR